MSDEIFLWSVSAVVVLCEIKYFFLCFSNLFVASVEGTKELEKREGRSAE